jgi:acyl-CoA dehydrogenase
LKLLVLPLGARALGPSDALMARCANILVEPSATRDRLTAGLYRGSGDDGLARLDRAFALVTQTEAIRDKLKRSGENDWRKAREQGLISEDEARRLDETDKAVAAVIEVDDFAPEELAPVGQAATALEKDIRSFMQAEVRLDFAGQ